MSAHKRTTISISAEEYRKLHEAAMQKRFVKNELPKIRKDLREETQSAIKQSFLDMNQRQQSFIKTIDQFQDDIRGVEWRTTQSLFDYQNDLWDSMDEFAGEIWTHATSALLEQRENLLDQLQYEHEQRQSEILQLSSKIQSSEQEEERRWDIAQKWLLAAVEMKDYIQEHYNYRKFSPDSFLSYETLLNLALQNQEQGIPESALIGAQQAYTGFSKLHIDLEKNTSQWEAHYYAALEQAKRLLRIIEHNMVSKAIDLEGNELDIDIDVDYWTQGDFSRQRNYLLSLIQQLETRSHILDLAMMRNLLEETFPSIEENVERLLASAKVNVISSQIRVNIADLVIQALQEQGYSFDSSGYDTGDMRHSYLASARNLEGSEVVIQVDPILDSETMNELHIHSYDKDMRTHHELRQRAKEINHALSRHGLQVGTTSTQPEVSTNLMQNIKPTVDFSKLHQG